MLERGQADGAVADPRPVRHQHKLRLKQRLDVQVLQFHLIAQRPDGEVEAPVADCRQKGGELRLIHRDPRLGESHFKLMHHLRHKGKPDQRRETKGDIHHRAVGQSIHFIDHIFHFTGDRF